MKEEAEAAVETAKGVLQDLVVVVSLVRTLTDSFGSASDLYRKLKRKAHLKNDDEDHDTENRKPLRRRPGSISDREKTHHRSVRWKLDPKKDDFSDSDEELICTSSSQIRAEYDRGYRRLGEPFARGDLTAQIQLQSQIIQLQQTLLNIHQDLLVSTYLAPSSNHSHLVRLIQTTRTARAASIQALNLQYQRLLPPITPTRPGNIPGAFPLPSDGDHDHLHVLPIPAPRRRDSCKSSSSESLHILPHPNPILRPRPPPQPKPNKLFCVYARDLQQNPQLPLTNTYKAGGDGICPFCHSYISIRPGKAWEIIADSCNRDRRPSSTFLIKNRFVIKSHQESGGFACVLCARFRRSDTVCRQIGALMEHLWRDHTSEELEKDEDVVEC